MTDYGYDLGYDLGYDIEETSSARQQRQAKKIAQSQKDFKNASGDPQVEQVVYRCDLLGTAAAAAVRWAANRKASSEAVPESPEVKKAKEKLQQAQNALSALNGDTGATEAQKAAAQAKVQAAQTELDAANKRSAGQAFKKEKQDERAAEIKDLVFNSSASPNKVLDRLKDIAKTKNYKDGYEKYTTGQIGDVNKYEAAALKRFSDLANAAAKRFAGGDLTYFEAGVEADPAGLRFLVLNAAAAKDLVARRGGSSSGKGSSGVVSSQEPLDSTFNELLNPEKALAAAEQNYQVPPAEKAEAVDSTVALAPKQTEAREAFRRHFIKALQRKGSGFEDKASETVDQFLADMETEAARTEPGVVDWIQTSKTGGPFAYKRSRRTVTEKSKSTGVDDIMDIAVNPKEKPKTKTVTSSRLIPDADGNLSWQDHFEGLVARRSGEAQKAREAFLEKYVPESERAQFPTIEAQMLSMHQAKTGAKAGTDTKLTDLDRVRLGGELAKGYEALSTFGANLRTKDGGEVSPEDAYGYMKARGYVQAAEDGSLTIKAGSSVEKLHAQERSLHESKDRTAALVKMKKFFQAQFGWNDEEALAVMQNLRVTDGATLVALNEASPEAIDREVARIKTELQGGPVVTEREAEDAFLLGPARREYEAGLAAKLKDLDPAERPAATAQYSKEFRADLLEKMKAERSGGHVADVEARLLSLAQNRATTNLSTELNRYHQGRLSKTTVDRAVVEAGAAAKPSPENIRHIDAATQALIEKQEQNDLPNPDDSAQYMAQLAQRSGEIAKKIDPEAEGDWNRRVTMSDDEAFIMSNEALSPEQRASALIDLRKAQALEAKEVRGRDDSHKKAISQQQNKASLDETKAQADQVRTKELKKMEINAQMLQAMMTQIMGLMQAFATQTMQASAQMHQGIAQANSQTFSAMVQYLGQNKGQRG